MHAIFLCRVGAGLAVPGHVVLRGPEGGALEPWLWVVPGPFQKYSRLLSLLGVADSLTPRHYEIALSAMASAACGLRVVDRDLGAALALAEGLVAVAAQQGECMHRAGGGFCCGMGGAWRRSRMGAEGGV